MNRSMPIIPAGRTGLWPLWLPHVVVRLLIPSLAAGLFIHSFAQASASSAPPTSVADPIEGVWTGTVTAPQGTVAEIGFEFFRAKHGDLIFRLNFPAMFTYNVTFGIPVEADGRGNYAITPAFNTNLHRDGDRLTGTFALGRLPLELKRGGSFASKPAAPTHAAAPAPLWTHPLGSGTWAPPMVDQNVIYVGTSDGRFHAINAIDGSGLWIWTGTRGIDGRAVVSADTVCFIDTGFRLVALNRADGTLRWTTPLHDEQIAGKPAPDNPTFNHRAATPLLLDGVLYTGSSDGGLYAINAATGARLWRHDAQAPVFSGVALHGTDTLMFGTMDGSVVLLDRRTQKEVLRVRTGGGVVTTPIVVDDKLIVGSRDYLLYGFNLADGSLAWKFSYWFSWIESTPVLRDGIIYVGASDYSRVTALDPTTGRARWSAEVHGMNWGSPLVTADRVFTGTASQNIPGTAIAHTGGILALDRATGAVLWQLVSPAAEEGKFGGYAGSLALAGDRVIAACFDGMLIALPAK
jgi:outer membrane protein assembly factor BamB